MKKENELSDEEIQEFKDSLVLYLPRLKKILKEKQLKLVELRNGLTTEDSLFVLETETETTCKIFNLITIYSNILLGEISEPLRKDISFCFFVRMTTRTIKVCYNI